MITFLFICLILVFGVFTLVSLVADAMDKTEEKLFERRVRRNMRKAGLL